jgi:ssDNA-binding Zn-finger/Zn-ribbon topoisomerase 1
MGLLSFLCGGFGKQPAPQTKPTTQTMPPGEISYSQLDITERFDDQLHLKPEEWISTVPLNKSVPTGKGLPPVSASSDEVYKAAERLSHFRESISIPNDGVYCPVCHIANTQLAKLRKPCPKCGRALLKFGWD